MCIYIYINTYVHTYNTALRTTFCGLCEIFLGFSWGKSFASTFPSMSNDTLEKNRLRRSPFSSAAMAETSCRTLNVSCSRDMLLCSVHLVVCSYLYLAALHKPAFSMP